MAAEVAIINYGMGNLRSVEKAIERVGAVPRITADPARIAAVDGVILPGVGAFPRAMERIAELGLEDPVRGAVAEGTPVLGICLGMQLLFASTTEGGGAAGLGLLDGKVERIDAPGQKLPHIGWSPLKLARDSDLTTGIDPGEPFYFVHSYAASPLADDLIATAAYGQPVAAIVGRDRIFGAQFHPEKSSGAGLRMLSNFVALCAPVPA